MHLFSNLLLSILLFLNGITGNLGFSIIAFTIIIRTALLPASIPSLKASKKMQEIQPEIKKLKEKHGDDKASLQAAQMDLYKKYNVNPLAGCLPQVVQLVVLIVLYRVLINLLNDPNLVNNGFNTAFFWLDLAKPDKTYVLPILAGASQLLLSLMISPGAEKEDIVPNKSRKKAIQEANKKEEDFAEMAQSMQKQMIFIMPLFTGVIAATFPSGLALYWVATTAYSLVQQYFISGPGGLTLYAKRALAVVGGGAEALKNADSDTSATDSKKKKKAKSTKKVKGTK